MAGTPVSPLRVLLPVGVGTSLSLLGDASLYAVLPTHTAEASVAVVSVGVLLSANRFVRLLLNGPVGVAFDRWPRRRLFVPALFIGALSTAIYGLTQGFVPLFLGRLLWGLAWSGIWVGGNTIVLDVSDAGTRGRWVGAYQVFFFAGAAGGALLGGFLTDRLGYHSAMVVNAGLTLLGALFALALLPETVGLRRRNVANEAPERAENAGANGGFAAAVTLYMVHRLAVAGVLQSTFGLLLLQRLGEQIQIGGRWLGVATLTGLGLGLSTLISATAAPLIGHLSDRSGKRWRVAAGGLLPGVAGFALLAAGLPAAILCGVPLIAVTSGSNQGLSTALIGDLGRVGRQSRRLGLLFTVGDLASAAGPPLAYGLIPLIGVSQVYLLVMAWLAGAFFVTLRAGRALKPEENF